MLLRYLFILFIIIPIKAFALIEVDITRGNLNPLPVAVSPLSIDNKSKKILKKFKTRRFRIRNFNSC
jgi:TolB protein